MKNVSVALFLFLSCVLAGCGGPRLLEPSSVEKPATLLPTKPPDRLSFGLGGQSNAKLLELPLREKADVLAYYGEVVSIAPCWMAGGDCWAMIQPQLKPALHAFVWSQGEYDALITSTPVATYEERQSDLVRRIREENGNPTLLVVVLQMGPMLDGPRGGVLGPLYQQSKRDWAARDRNAIWIETQDLGFDKDEVHMTPDGYARLSARIDERVRARLGLSLPSDR